MSVSPTMKATQQHAGSRITAACRAALSDASDYSSYMSLGVTASATPPATFADVAHVDGLPDSLTSSFWDSAAETFTQSFLEGALVQYTDTYTLQVEKRLDSHYLAGHYLWFLGWHTNAPGGSDAPDWHAGPYLIR